MQVLMSDHLATMIDLEPDSKSREEIKIKFEDELKVCEFVSACFSEDRSLSSITLTTKADILFELLNGKKITSIDFCHLGYNYVLEKYPSITITKNFGGFYTLEISLEKNDEKIIRD